MRWIEVDAAGAWNEANRTYEVTLRTLCPGAEIRYALNDSVVTASSTCYAAPIPLTEDAVVYAAAYRDGKPLGRVTQTAFAVNKATGCTYSYSETPSLGDLCTIHSLTDGRQGVAPCLLPRSGVHGIRCGRYARHGFPYLRMANISNLWPIACSPMTSRPRRPSASRYLSVSRR